MTSNPMFRTSVAENAVLDSKPMTIQGTVNKTLILTAIVAIAGYFSWTTASAGYADKIQLITWSGLIIGFILALITTFKPNTSHITAPAYAICEGAALGGISFVYNYLYDGIVVNAVMITLLALFTMLLLYKTKLVQNTPVFRQVVVTSTIAIAIFYLVGIVAMFLGHPMTIFNGGLMGIGVSAVICVIAALNFILDFDFINKGEQHMLPQYFEWYGAFGLLVTLIWLYLEVLRLLAQLNRRN